MSKTPFEQELTYQIIAAAIDVHKHLGPGLLESAYRFCLGIELKDRGLSFKQEIAVPLTYKCKKFDCGFRADLIIEDLVILELKSIVAILPVHEAQILTYLRLMNKEVGLLINFNEKMLKQGIRRFTITPHPIEQSSEHSR